jgi:hypothetical protein
MTGNVHIEWARASTPPTREVIDQANTTGDPPHWLVQVQDAVAAHWSSGAPQMTVGFNVVVFWIEEATSQGHTFSITLESGMTSQIWLSYVQDEIANQWGSHAPQP